MKQTVIGFIFCISFSLFTTPAIAQVERPVVIDKLLETEPEVGRFVDQWYSQLMQQVQFIKDSQNHWNKMRDSGDLSDSDYDFVINRDVTRSIERLKTNLPAMKTQLRQGIADIRNQEYALYRFTASNTLGYLRTISISANGTTTVEGQTVAEDGSVTPEKKTLMLTPQQLTELKQAIEALQPFVKDVPPLLGQGFTSITVYNAGEFITYDHAEQPKDTARDNLIMLVESWID